MTDAQALITVGIVALCTLLTRALPFALFPANRKTPALVAYLGRVLPYAVIGMLIVYCLKDVNPLKAPHGLPEALGIAAVAALYAWRRSSLLAIAGGTAVYMALVRLVF